jgi:hypothetical protein
VVPRRRAVYAALVPGIFRQLTGYVVRKSFELCFELCEERLLAYKVEAEEDGSSGIRHA